MYIPNQLEETEFKKTVMKKKLLHKQNQWGDEGSHHLGLFPQEISLILLQMHQYLKKEKTLLS